MTDTTERRLADIERQNARIVVLLEHLTQRVESRIQHDDAWRTRTDLILMGDGNGRAGHNVKLDRLERTQRAQLWVVRTLAAAMIGMLLKMVTEAL